MKAYQTHTLDCGLRIIHHHNDSPIVYCGFAVKAGSCDEKPGEEGLAHFCEHGSFKGTSQRKASRVIQTLEELGGELNAYTNKEATVYHCAILKEHINKAIDLLADMVFHSTYPENEMEKEKDVICEEIESYNDSPADLIYDDFENIIFQQHPLGHNILGSIDNVRRFTSADARRFTAEFYQPDNAIFFVDGAVDFSKVCRRLAANAAFADAEPRESKTKESVERQQDKAVKASDGGASQTIIRDLSTHQAHVMIGCKAYDIHHPRRIALYLLNNIIGGPAMSSRLNMSLRERHGLVYTVESSMASYADTGIWSVYFGCDPSDVSRCQRLVRKELDRLMQTPLTPRKLEAAKRQLKGQIALACDSRESFALDFAKSFLHYGWEKDVTALCRHIDSVTSADLLAVAQELFAVSNLKVLIYR